jgi:site-specific DNA-methyltransferase (adenine-specific)
MRKETMIQENGLSSAPVHGIVRLPPPYYDEDGITIYCADCLEILPFIESVDVTFSSPPYNTIAATNPSGMMAEHNHKQNKGYDGFSDDMPEMEYQAWMRDVFGLCRAVSKGLVWINHKTRYREKQGVHPLAIFNWPFYSEVVWDRGGSITMNARKFAPSHEYIYGFGVPHYWDNAVNTMMSVWRIMPERDVKGHPCPFPVSIASRCITASCPEGGVVLDPFMGSGTTGVACIREGRNFIGIEKDEKYFQIAVERIRRELAQERLF